MHQVMRSLRVFRGCPEQDLAALAALAERRTLAAGEVLFRPGDAGRSLFVVLHGRIHVSTSDAADRLEGPGEKVLEAQGLFGVSAALDSPRRATATALEPSAVLELPMLALDALQQRAPSVHRVIQEIQFKVRHADQLLGWLRHTRLFRDLPQRELKQVLSILRLRQYAAGSTVIRQGEKAASMGLIVRGEARLVLDVGRQKRVSLAALTEGDLYGETGLIPDSVREASLEALTPLTVLLLFQADLEAIAGETPYLLQAVSRTQAERVEGTLEARRVRNAVGTGVALISRKPEAGRTTLAMALARSASAQQLKVALVDATPPGRKGTARQRLGLDAKGFITTHSGPDWEAREWPPVDGVSVLELQVGQAVTESALAQWLETLKVQFDLVVLDLPPASLYPDLSERLLEGVEWVLSIDQGPGLEPLSAQAQRRELIHLVPDAASRPALPYLGRDIQRLPWEPTAFSGRAAHGWPLSHQPDHPYMRQVRRLKRILLRKQVGIALAGGGNWGLTHIGVLQVLEENRVAVDLIAGTSAGAIVGGLFACGRTGRQIEAELRGLVPGLLRYTLPSKLGRTQPGKTVFERLLRTLFHGEELTTVRTPFWPHAMDFETGEEVVFRHGPVSEGVMAAASLPGLFPPYFHNGRLLLDGGFVNNLPLGTLYDMGCNVSIGVNCVPLPEKGTGTPSTADRLLEQVSPLAAPRQSGAGHTGLAGPMFRPLLTPRSALSTFNQVMRGIQILCHRVGEDAGRLADVYIAPAVGQAQWFDFHKAPAMIAAGRRGATEALERILEVCPRDE